LRAMSKTEEFQREPLISASTSDTQSKPQID